jgi:hypothetical protein
MYPPKPEQPEQRELIDRLMFAQANEAARCYEEGVLRSVADGNIGSIFGWGFAPFQGGRCSSSTRMGGISSRNCVITFHLPPSGPTSAGVMNLVRMSASVSCFLSTPVPWCGVRRRTLQAETVQWR